MIAGGRRRASGPTQVLLWVIRFPRSADIVSMEQARFPRRQFLMQSASGLAAAGVVAGIGPGLTGAAQAFAKEAGDGQRRYKKAVKIGMVREGKDLREKFALVKSLGFDGIELNSPGLNREEAIRARDEVGLPIHGVVDSVHWKDTLSHPDPEVRARGVQGLKTALADAKAIGADTVLLVPAVVNKEVSYEDAYHRSQAEIRKALPVAEETGVKILFENVWNNFLLSPLELARYIDEFESPLVGSYFDVGNVVRYGWPEQWIRTLGKRIVKLDIKEYSRQIQMNEGVRKGFGVELLEGDCDWPAVMQALRDINFSGWGTAEVPGGDRERLKVVADRMDRIFAS